MTLEEIRQQEFDRNQITVEITPKLTWKGDRQDTTRNIAAKLRQSIAGAGLNQEDFSDECLIELVFKAQSMRRDEAKNRAVDLGYERDELRHDRRTTLTGDEKSKKLRQFELEIETYRRRHDGETNFLLVVSEVSNYVAAQRLSDNHYTLINAQGQIHVLKKDTEYSNSINLSGGSDICEWQLDEYTMPLSEAELRFEGDWDLWETLELGSKHSSGVDDPRIIFPLLDQLQECGNGTVMFANGYDYSPYSDNSGIFGKEFADYLQTAKNQCARECESAQMGEKPLHYKKFRSEKLWDSTSDLIEQIEQIRLGRSMKSTSKRSL